MQEIYYTEDEDVVNSVRFLPFGKQSHGITFDRLRLSIPLNYVSVMDRSRFTTSLNGYGEVLNMKFEQKIPFFFSVYIDNVRHSAILEFNGKALVNRYPELINSANIHECINNINAMNVCHIEPYEAIQSADILQCDVTKDINSDYRIPEIYGGLMMQNNRQWSLRDITTTRFAIENTVVSKRKKTRLTIYDKEIEMNRNENDCFLKYAGNREQQLDYFRNKIRYELKLNSLDRMRHFFGITEKGPIKLSTLLNADLDPIEEVLSQIVPSGNATEMAMANAQSVRELEHLLLMTFLGFDMELLERVVRRLSSQSRSIKKAMVPYFNIRQCLNLKNIDPCKNLCLTDVKNQLKYMITLTMPIDNEDGLDSVNIYNIY